MSSKNNIRSGQWAFSGNWALVDAVGQAAAEGIPDLEETEIHVLIALAKLSDESGQLDFIDQQVIGNLTGYRWPVVELAIHRLRWAGFIDDSAEPYRIRHAKHPADPDRLVLQPDLRDPEMAAAGVPTGRRSRMVPRLWRDDQF